MTRRWSAIAAGLSVALAATIPWAPVGAQQATTIHIEVDGGPRPGTYDVSTQAPCTYGSLAPGTWGVNVRDAAAEPSTFNLNVSESDPTSDSFSFSFGDPSTYSGPFYRSIGSHPIETTVDDQGGTATLTLTADWMEAYAEDGTDMSGASATVTVACGQVTRTGEDDDDGAQPVPSLAPPPDIDSLPPGTRIATGRVTWTSEETYDNPDVPESSHTVLTMVVDVAMYEAESRWLDAGSRFTITGTETRADFTSTDATGKSCTITGWLERLDGDEAFSASPWMDTEWQPMISLEIDPSFGGALGAWGSAGTVADWTEVGDGCDPPGPRHEEGRVLFSMWCRTPEDRLQTLGSLSADGTAVDLACSHAGRVPLSGNANIDEAVTVSGVIRLETR